MTVKGTARTTNLASDPVYKTATPGTKKQMRRDRKTARAKALLVEKAAASAASELAAEKKKRESLAVEPVVSPVVQTVVVTGSHSDEGPEPDDESCSERPAPPQPRPSEAPAGLTRGFVAPTYGKQRRAAWAVAGQHASKGRPGYSRNEGAVASRDGAPPPVEAQVESISFNASLRAQSREIVLHKTNPGEAAYQDFLVTIAAIPPKSMPHMNVYLGQCSHIVGAVHELSKCGDERSKCRAAGATKMHAGITAWEDGIEYVAGQSERQDGSLAIPAMVEGNTYMPDDWIPSAEEYYQRRVVDYFGSLGWTHPALQDGGTITISLAQRGGASHKYSTLYHALLNAEIDPYMPRQRVGQATSRLLPELQQWLQSNEAMLDADQGLHRPELTGALGGVRVAKAQVAAARVAKARVAKAQVAATRGWTGRRVRDTRITVSHVEDKKEYQRQLSYIKNNPGCLSVLPRRVPLTDREPRVTVSRAKDKKEYQRQFAYIKRHPGCLSVPPKAKRYKGTK